MLTVVFKKSTADNSVDSLGFVFSVVPHAPNPRKRNDKVSFRIR